LTRLLALLLMLWLSAPVAAQSPDPDALIDGFATRRDAGEDKAQIAAEIAPYPANPPLSESWIALFMMQSELLLETEGPEAALRQLQATEGYFYSLPEADPLFLDWILILQGLRYADLGYFGDAADQLEPLLGSIQTLYGDADAEAIAAAIPQWRAVMLFQDSETAMMRVNSALAAFNQGDLARASDIAQPYLLPRAAIGDDAISALIVATAHTVLSLVEETKGKQDAARALAREAVRVLTEPEWDGAGPIVLRPMEEIAELSNLAFLTLMNALTQEARAGSNPPELLDAVETLAVTPFRRSQFLNHQIDLAAEAADLTAMLALLREKQDLEARDPTLSAEIRATTAYFALFVEAVTELKAGRPVDVQRLQQTAENSESGMNRQLFVDLLAKLARQYLTAPEARIMAQDAIALRAETVASFNQSEAERDSYLRAGRELTEIWLNAAFRETKETIGDFPAADMACSDDTDEAFCVIWVAD
jgi:hypothetical protein